MGADGGGNEPHAAKRKPPVPCDDKGLPPPGPSGWTDVTHLHGSPLVNTANNRPQPVTEPASYAVAGKVLLAAAGALAGVLLALVAMYLYNTARRRRLRAGGGVGGGGVRRRLDRSPAIVLAGAGGEDDRTADGTPPSPRGLDPAVLRALPVVVVTAAAAQRKGDCAVCLAELEPGDKARTLPRCAHLFHADCIDAWFRGNATCPLCRADVVLVVAPGDDVRIDVDGDDAARAKDSVATAAAMGRLPSGTDLVDSKSTSTASFASARSVSF